MIRFILMQAVALGVSLGALGGAVWAVRGRSSTLLAPSVWRGCGARPSLALTFDDGPSESTPGLLRILEKHSVKATFFVCGANVARLPSVHRDTAAAGHEIGNHTWSHRMLFFQSPASIRREMESTQQEIAAVTGSAPALFRPPFGVRAFGLGAVQRQLGVTSILWTVLGRDWMLDAEGVVARVCSRVRPGCIVCLHDGRATRPRPDVSNTLRAVDRLIPLLRERGFGFETISQILCPTQN